MAICCMSCPPKAQTPMNAQVTTTARTLLKPSGEPLSQEGAPKEQTPGLGGPCVNLSGIEDRGSGKAWTRHVSYVFP
jgi:hypothetical protein